MRKILVVGIGLGGLAVAGHEPRNPVKVISAEDITEKFDGKNSKATTREVMIEPGQGGQPYLHRGPIFSYVLEGQYT